MNKDYFAIMNEDLQAFNKKETRNSPAVAWIGSNNPTVKDIWKAAKAHNMSVAEFRDYMEQFRSFYH